MNTSAAANASHIAGGKREAQQKLVLEAVRENPGMTARELAAVYETGNETGGDKITHETFHKRLPELRDEGFIDDGAIRTCSVTGRMAKTWILIYRA